MKQNSKIWKHAAIALIVGITFAGCKKPNDGDNNDTDYYGNGTFIVCEGSFNQGNGRLDFYNKNTEELKTNIFESVNGTPLGDVFQSVSIVNDKAYLVVNNSGKIEVANPYTLESEATITGFTSPRYMCALSNSKAYVSDLFSGSVSIVNLSTNAVVGSISIPGWTEEMLVDNGKVWITNGMKDYTYITQNDAVVDSVNVGYGSTSIRKGSDGDIWVLTGGNYPPTQVNSRLNRINSSTFDVEWYYDFNNYGASKIRTNADKTELYFLFDGKVYRKSATDNSTPVEFISISGKSFYGMNVDPATGNIWLGDAGDFSSAGTVYVYNSAGTQIKTFSTGVAPSDFVF